MNSVSMGAENENLINPCPICMGFCTTEKCIL